MSRFSEASTEHSTALHDVELRTLTPKELDFLFQLLEKVSEEMYKRGHADGAAKKPVSNQSFAVGKNNRLVIKTNLKKFTEKR